ncbi:DNA ligase D [Aquabacterium humicola]|uniref:DNA ligase D n=1 Tax=Aquabacterium humicola TaxID=3237377 RepID=UPI002542B3A9|nr:DNA ligase D [Rubrivivax pictus]
MSAYPTSQTSLSEQGAGALAKGDPLPRIVPQPLPPQSSDDDELEALRQARRRRDGPRLPERLAPQLALASTRLPVGGDWRAEIKFDGYRLLARVEASGAVRLFTRNGQDWTARLGRLAQAVGAIAPPNSWLDGEIVVPGDDGRADFNRLQNALDGATGEVPGLTGDRTGDHAAGQRSDAVVFWLFDAPFLDGRDLRELPLRERRARLQRLFGDRAEGDGPAARVRFSADLGGDLASALRRACADRLEGVVAKRQDAPYVSRRSDSWLKLKCQLRQEFVIGGFTDRADSAQAVGSLLLGHYDHNGRLLSAGRVGTGFDVTTAIELRRRLAALQTGHSPFEGDEARHHSRGAASGRPHWVRPRVVAEVSFSEWTPEGQVRHAVFQGLRRDKPPRQVHREATLGEPGPALAAAAGEGPRAVAAAHETLLPPPASAGAPPSGGGNRGGDRSDDGTPVVAGIVVSHPERVIDARSGARKLDLVRYYEAIAEHLLPHLRGRPVALLRAPGGVDGETFFQRHAGQLRIPGLRVLDPVLWPGHEPLIEITSVEALVGAAQMNVVEFHGWNAASRRVDLPNRMVLDLDPGEGVAWETVRESAALVRDALDELGLRSWLKTSGGKGLHVVVPIAARWPADVVRGFSRLLVRHLARGFPERFVATSGASNRIGRIFVDYLRNGLGATTAVAFSARARPGLGVSMPVPWERLDMVESGAHWTIADAAQHVRRWSRDPWTGFFASRQGLTAAMKRLGFDAAASANEEVA